MTASASILLVAAGAAALTDWFAVAATRRRLEYVAKPAVMVGLIAVALALRPADSAERAFFVVALALGLLSDVFLMLPRDMFLAGLAAALVEHLAYIAGFRTRGLNVGWLLIGAAIALVSTAAIFPPIYRALRNRQPKLVAPVIAYLAVFVIMVASAGGTGSLVALAGALLFLYSDAILAWNRFVNPIPAGRIANIVPYHVGEALLVLSLLM
ncbi:MAG TPA: lysoplasmalogenase [Candidatus Dormibacteraeota bacterium]|nr:lysoplasmalogenase [Candidatus Dormibacteraeota bacterium]